MLFYNTPNPAPNPRRVRMLLSEKEISVPTKDISIETGENRTNEYLRINPLGQVPALVLDSGEVLTESVAICRYFEALHPTPPLFGIGAQNVAEVDMWIRRIEFRLGRAISMVWLHTHPFTASFVRPQYKEFGEDQRRLATSILGEFNHALNDREWLDKQRFTMADIVLLTQIDFAKFVGIDLGADHPHLKDWYTRASLRPSAQA